MKKQFFYLLTFLFVSQFAWADGATDVPYNDIDTLGRCDEQYFSVIKLKIKRPEAIPFTINAKGGKVEFSTGNLQYQPATNAFRFATRQWESIGAGDTTGDDRTSSGSVYWDSIVVRERIDPRTGEVMYNSEGARQYVYETFKVFANNRRISKSYLGWIDLFGWGTSGFNPNAPKLNVRKDPYSLCTKPYSTSSSQVNTSYNTYGYGPSYNYTGVRAHFDTLDKVSRNYDWGYNNYIYSKWVGYDTTKANMDKTVHIYCFRSSTGEIVYTKTLEIGARTTLYTLNVPTKYITAYKKDAWIEGTVGKERACWKSTGSSPSGGTVSLDVCYDRYLGATATIGGLHQDQDAKEVSPGGEDLILFDSTIFEPRVWRTLTDTEWKYMLNTRKIENKKSLPWSFITIAPAIGNEFPGNGGADPLGPKVAVNGLLIFPDHFELAQAMKVGFDPAEKSKIAYGSVRNFGTDTRLSYKSFTALEKLGVVFLPVMASRKDTEVRRTYIDYWSANRALSSTPAANAMVLRLRANTAGTNVFTVTNATTYSGNSVRLVRDLDVTKTRLVSVYQ